jgi:hypothetical protein
MDSGLNDQVGPGQALPRFFQALIEAGALDETQTEPFVTGDVSTGVGMLTALARLNMIRPEVDEVEATRARSWSPSWIPIGAEGGLDADKYIVSENNKEVFDTLNERLSHPPGPVGELYCVRSESGIGKTHLLSSLYRNTPQTSRLVNVMDLDVEMELAVRRRERAEFFGWLLKAEVLLLDDIQSASENLPLQKALRYIISTNQNRNGIVVVTIHQRFGEEGFDAELLSLMDSGTHYQLELPDEFGRLSALRTHFGSMDIPDDAAQYLAANVNESMRQLMNAASQLINLSRQTATPITRDMARAVLPLPQDLLHKTSVMANTSMMLSDVGLDQDTGDRAHFFREILSNAENEDEQALALQIALGQRLRELKEQDNTEASVMKMEKTLSLLRDGKLEEAIRCIGS